MYILAQVLGIQASIIAIISFNLRKKWQILLLGMFANFLSTIVFLLLKGFGSAVVINIIAVVHCGINTYLSYNGKEASMMQKVVFMLLFLVGGILSYNVPLDILPISASFAFAMSVFQNKEQRLRMFSLVNVALWIVYDAIVGTTAIFGQIFSLVSILIALYRFRRKNDENCV